MNRSLLAGVITAAVLVSGTPLGTATRADAQSRCPTFESIQRVAKFKSALKDMSSRDPAFIDKNIAAFTTLSRQYRGVNDPMAKVFEDALDFWREKRANLALGDMAEVHSGQRWAEYLRKNIADEDVGIVGTWNWWNGYTVTFNSNGGASYQGSNLARSGVGRWDKTGENSYHVHWLGANTNDYFTLPSDGMKLEGRYDGKPGVSTRRC